MSEIMALRTQILDNIKTIHFDFKTESRFVLTCNSDGGTEEWTVVLGLPEDPPSKYSHVYPYGKGDSPKAAYKDLLRNTALELDGLGYTLNW